MTKIDRFIEIVDFENKDNYDQLSEFSSNLQHKQIEIKSINSQIEQLITIQSLKLKYKITLIMRTQ